jgi:trehalose/maltose transport system permease protein
MVIGSRIVKGLKGTGSGYWMALPALLAIVAIVAYPLAFATYYSFRRVLPNLAGEFIGLENYSQMLEDPDFAEALNTTLVFTAASGGLSFFGRGALAAAAFLPWVFPPVVVATFGRLALFSGVGPLSRAAEVLGFGNGELLLVDQGVLLSVAVVVDVWRTAPFVALLLLAALRTIPGDVYEAARVDGADTLQRFFSITLPLLKPALMVVLLLRLLDAFRVFDLFRVLGAQNLASLHLRLPGRDAEPDQLRPGQRGGGLHVPLRFLRLPLFRLRVAGAGLDGPRPLRTPEGCSIGRRRDYRWSRIRAIRARARGDALGPVFGTAGLGLLGERHPRARRRTGRCGDGPVAARLPHGLL